MYIQQIEIDNFKSFSEKTVIPFERGFTTVSGPNGSGKSNIIDSVLFCLGLSSSRTMRAEKLTDLINNISRRREASVTIMFGQSDDPTDEKIIVGRRIKDNGASGYASTYYLNGKTATLTEIHDRLSQHNISPGAYNVLMQGDVAGIINMSATERRKIIDEIAGVAEFDRKIDQAERELSSVSSSIERFTLLLEELNTRVTQLAAERDQALKYQKLKDEKQQFESMMLTAKLADLLKAVQAAENNIVEARKNKASQQKQLQELEAIIAKTQAELTEVANEVKRKGEDQQIALKKQIEGLKGAISRNKDSIQFGHQKKQESHTMIARVKDEIVNAEGKLDDLNTAIEGYEQLGQEIQALLDKELASLDKVQQELTQLANASGELGERHESIRRDIQTAQDKLGDLNRQKLDAESDLARQAREKQFILEQSSSGNQRLAEISPQHEKLSKKLKDVSLEKQAFESQINAQQLDYSKVRVSLNTVSSELNQLIQQFNRLDAQKRAYEDVNFGRSIDTVLNAGIEGVHGTLSQLGTVDADYAVALEIALGGRLKSIVVDDDQVGEDCIELLKRAKAGRATFLPLTKMRSNANLGLLPDDEGIIDYAINLMQFDSEYDNVFGYALGDTVIVEDAATARRYMRRFRMVTLDGSLFEKTGAMTGGSYQQQAGGKLSTGKLDQEIADLRQQIERKDNEKERLERQLSQTEIKLSALKEDYNQFLTQSQVDQVTFDALDRELAQLQQTAGAQADTEVYDEKIKSLTTLLEQLTADIQETQEHKDTLEASLVEINAQLPTEAMERLNRELKDIQFQSQQYESRLRNNDGDIKSKQLEKEFVEKSVNAHQMQIEQLQNTIAEQDKDRVRLEEEILLIEKQITGLEAQAGELDEELKRLQEQRDVVQKCLIQEEQQKYNLTQQMVQIDEQIAAYQSRKRELQPQIEVVKTEMTEAGLSTDIDLTNPLPGAEEILANIQKLDKAMDAMGAVNMRAIQEYDEVLERREELGDKINTLSREKEDLTIKISGYGELKLHAFKTAFDNVDNNFREIFQTLSDGEGQLVLTNPEDPFSGGLTIQARPRGKKMLRLEAMSGGEKSLTSLAFVFAFQQYLPSPFYAFDEVDMNLDGLNVEKLAHMLKRQSGSAQFIVVSHRKPMLESSDRTVGVTQKKGGATKVTGVVLRDAS